MDDGEDWVMRPALKGMCKYESLIDCTLNLADVTKMNIMIDIATENENRAREASKDG